MRLSIWITGANGRVGRELYRLIANESTRIITTDIDVDITDLETVTQFAAINHPDVIINCAAVTDPEYCENNRTEAFRVNALGARNIAVAAHSVNAKLIHISTDDIFENTHDGFFNEFDVPAPVSVYAKSKLAGEMMVRELVARHIIIRTSWLYGGVGDNFVTRVISAAKENKPIEIVKDRQGSPTSVNALAEVIKKLIGSNEYGIFHIACEGSCTREEFARAILDLNGLDGEFVYKKARFRPNNARIENLMLKMTGIHEMPNWYDALKNFNFN